MSASANSNVVQPASFAFTPENMETVKKIVAKYPEGRQGSAVMPLLDLAQRQHGWVPQAAMDEIARILDMAPIRVYEVATFYTMYNLQPVGKYLIQVCRTTPCWLRGSDNLTDYLKKRLGVGMKEVTKDGLFSMMEVECLGACCNAPMVQINDDFYEDLTPETLGKVMDDLAAGKKPQIGPQINRRASMAEGGQTTLKEIPLSYDMSRDLVGGK